MDVVPASVAQAARARVESAEAQAQRAETLKAVFEGRPLDAERDTERKIRYVQKDLGVTRTDAAAIAREGGAEVLQGDTDDLLGFYFLESAVAAGAAVARIIFRNGDAQGTGFLISNRLLLTNNHVLRSAARAGDFLAEFRYQRDGAGRPLPATRFALNADAFFITDPTDDLDFSLIALGPHESGPPADPPEYGYLRLSDRDDKHALGVFVNIIGHPDGDFKQVALRENRLVTRLDKVLHYFTDTLPGSSGSPVFNDRWEVVALHHWGGPHRQTSLPDGQRVPRNVNEGIRVSAIVARLRAAADRLDAPRRRLLEDALRGAGEATPGTPRPAPILPYRETSLMNEDDAPRDARASYPDHHGSHNGAAASAMPSAPGGSVTFTLPLEITVRIPGATSVTIASGTAAVRQTTDTQTVPVTPAVTGGEAVRIDRNYANRNGYDADFLGIPVPLPRLSAAQRAVAAQRLDRSGNSGGSGEDACTLEYQNFSVVLNRARRMAFFTAANLDGGRWVDIDRDTGRRRSGGGNGEALANLDAREAGDSDAGGAAEGAEASETWYRDDRIAPDDQSDQRLYSGQHPRRLFDRGHLVRRQDPTWGDAAERANADTFHFTNCTPQASRFNQRTEYWQGIEGYVLKNARAERQRVTVLTGPVFDDDHDPRYRYVKVPRQFWKIVVRVEGGRLLATALLASQAAMLSSLPEALEGAERFDDLGEVAQYQTSVARIERLTGLDFGDLRDHDTYTGGEETPQRRIDSFEAISLGDDVLTLSHGDALPATATFTAATSEDALPESAPAPAASTATPPTRRAPSRRR